MVTHDLRMVTFVDKVVRMVDGRILDVLIEREEIEALAKTSREKARPTPA
jgi:ABC-type lipoprotein export system ATPase subunit